MPTDDSITVDTPYTIYVQTQAASPATIPNSFTYTKPAGITTVTDGTVAVDIDDNMIPVTYVGYDGNGGGHWAVVSDTDIQNNPGSWYDYGEKQWANAVTVQNPSEYTNAATGTEVNNNDVLGYWVYIPRYAYKVQRRDAYNPTNQTSANSAVSAKNFDIVFETNSDPVKQPIECNTGDYQTCVKNQYGASALTYPNTTSQDDPLNTQTAWATHPAFTWGSEELNGFWIGKFETTGTRTAPTVKPNQHANVNEYIGDFYTMAWSIGKGTYSP